MRYLFGILCLISISFAHTPHLKAKQYQERALDLQKKDDFDKAFPLFQKACEEKMAMSCFYLGNLYEKGLGTNQDHKKAEIFWQKANALYQKECDKGEAESCYILAQSYYYGKGEKADTQKALELWEKACKFGDAGGCNDAGLIYAKGEGVEPNLSYSKQLFQKACQMDYDIACYNLKTYNIH